MPDINNSFNHINNSNVTVNLPEYKVLPQLTSRLGKDTIIGREKELKEIDKLLNSSNSLLLINGIGGIGKSTIASYYLHSQIKNNDNLKYYGFFEGIDSFLTELRSRLDIKAEKEDEAFMEALTKLSALKGDKLLVIDDVKNIEENQDKIDKILALENSGYKILLTSREEIEDITRYELDVLSMDDAKKLFNSIYGVENEVLLEEILNYLDCHAFFVEMTAKTLKSKKTLTPELIKEKFENGEFSTITRKRKESFNDYLNELFSFDELDDEEILMLKQLSVLPSIEIELEFLEEVFDRKDDEEFEELLNYLCEKGWLSSFRKGYKLHQIVKEYIWITHLPSFEEIIQIVTFYNFLLKNSTDAQVAIFNKKYLVYFSAIAQFLKKIKIENKGLISIFLNFLGLTYRHLGNYKKALLILEEALVLSNDDLIFKASVHNNLGTVYMSMYNEEEAIKHTILSLDIREVFDKDNIAIADGYSNLGIQYEKKGNYEKALILLEKSIKIKEKLFHLDNSVSSLKSMGYSYHNLAGIYESLNRYDEAIIFYDKTYLFFKKVYNENHPDFATLFNNLFFLYLKMNKLDKAKDYIEKAISIREEVLPPNHSELLLAKQDLINLEIEIKRKQPIRKNPKIKRNDPCPCNSGKKYKKCCGKNS